MQGGAAVRTAATLALVALVSALAFGEPMPRTEPVYDRWESYIPVDGERTPTGVGQPGVWWLDDGVNPVRRYRRKESTGE